MKMKNYGPRELFRECERELAQRRRVYARLVSQGKMKQTAADEQIAMLIQIRDRYGVEAEAEEQRGRLI